MAELTYWFKRGGLRAAIFVDGEYAACVFDVVGVKKNMYNVDFFGKGGRVLATLWDAVEIKPPPDL